MSHLMNTYNRQPVCFDHGEGVWLTDTDGKRYLDALGGIAVSTLGHGHPRLCAVIAEQAKRVIHTSNIYRIGAQEQLSDRLAEISGMEEVFFCNSGCEANEASIKLARLFGHRKGIDQPVIIVMEHAFHGRTLATLSATGNRKVQAGFEPLVNGFVRVPYNDIDAVRRLAQHNSAVAAVLLEVVQGEGGIHLADSDYLRELRALCDQQQWLLMFDEIQCGMGRTGEWFGWQHADVRPDVMSLAKGLASGVPIGACVAAGQARGLFGPGNHGSTFGGNPLACAAALETINVMQEDRLVENARQVGTLLLEEFRRSLADLGSAVTVRGYGLMIGIELDRPCGALVGQALEAGLLINVTAEKVIRLLPPLIFSSSDAHELVSRLTPLIRSLMAQ